MNKVDVLVCDGHLYLRGFLSADLVGAMIGALGADAYKWEEWRYAMDRFLYAAEEPQHLGLQSFSTLADAIGHDGVGADVDCLVDLPARMLLTRWDQTVDPIPARFVDVNGASGPVLSYDLSADWWISSNFDQWQQRADERRQRNDERSRIKLRTVLYGSELLSFLIGWCQSQISQREAAVGGKKCTSMRADRSASELETDQTCVGLEAWLGQRPEALLGQTVEEAMLRDHDHIIGDLEDRESQWSRAGAAPIGLRESDTAYRQSAFGPHELILYCELLQHLVHEYVDRLHSPGKDSGNMEKEIKWLSECRDQWLWRVDEDELMGKSPRDIINLERCRLPLVVENPKHIDHDDCPLCQLMMSQDGGPVFWRLGGTLTDRQILGGFNLHGGMDFETDGVDWPDDDTTQADSTARRQPTSRGSIERSRLEDVSAILPPMDPIWKRVCILNEPGEVSPEVDLFTVAACTGELIEDLKERAADRSWIDVLNRHVGNLDAALRASEPTLLEPVVTRFCECLDQLQSEFEELADKLDDLQTRLIGLVQRFDS